MESARNFPYLRKIPGFERMELSTSDFEPRNRSLLMTWGLIFFALAIASAVLSWTVFTEGHGQTIFVLSFVLFGVLGTIALLARVVNTPVG